MRRLRWVRLVCSLLFVGILGGLMAPLSSEALTVTMNGSPVSTASRSCDAGYTLCLSIVNGSVAGGTWKVGNASTTNTARVMIADNSTANSLDLLKLTGITFEPVGPTPGVARTLTVVVTHAYNAGGGNPAGNYSWGYGMSGYYDPPGGPTPAAENIVGNRLRQTGNGNFAGTNVTLGSGLDTGVLATPSTNNLNGSISRTSPATVVRPNCNTGSNRCAPTITQTYTITVVGADKLVMTDSFIAGGGTCRAVDEVIPIAPHLYALMLKLDPQAPNDINQLSEWLKRMGEKYLRKPIQKKLLAYLIHELDKWLAKTVPGTCPEVEGEVDEVLLDDVEDLEREIVRLTALGEVFETAQPGGTITITKNTTEATTETFTFDIIGPESSTTETIAMDGQTSQSIVVTVEPGTYQVNEINNPEGWSFKNANCGDNGDPTSSGVVGVVVEVDNNVNCTFNNNPSNGTIKIVKYMDTNVTGGLSNFVVTGNGISNFSLTANATQAGSKTFTGLATGAGGGARTITETSFPDPHLDGELSVWHLDSVVCEGTPTPLEEDQVTINTGPDVTPPAGLDLVGVTVNYVNADQTVTCRFDNHHTHDGEPSPFGHNGTGPGGHPATIIEQ